MHTVKGDRLGPDGWHRFTCYGEECAPHATCLRQPSMSLAQWAAAKAAFLAAHETDERDVKGWPCS